MKISLKKLRTLVKEAVETNRTMMNNCYMPQTNNDVVESCGPDCDCQACSAKKDSESLLGDDMIYAEEKTGDEQLPSDYETCGDCGYDHAYEPREAYKWHKEHDVDEVIIYGRDDKKR